MRNKVILTIIFLGLGYLAAMFLNRPEAQPSVSVQVPAQINTTDQAIQAEVTRNVSSSQSAASTTVSATKLDVPFVMQAPFGNWSDPVFQNACEEASITMAMSWINGVKNITPGSAQKQILDIVKFENKTFGYNADTDIFGIQKIFQQHFQRNVTVRENITTADIINELQKGNLVLVPAFGQALGNPNYTAPGPVEHMLVIIGYDPQAKEFITNDSGTRHGASYRYDEKTLFDAVWEYSSGSQTVPVPIGVLKKAMIVVQK